MLARAASAQDRCMERASSITDAPAASFGRERNNVRYSTWGVYLKGEGKGLKSTLRRLQDAASCHKAKVPGRKQQDLRFEKVSRHKVQISWPRPVSADACARVLKLALGENWRDLVTDPAGVQGADQTAATAKVCTSFAIKMLRDKDTSTKLLHRLQQHKAEVQQRGSTTRPGRSHF